MCYCITFYSREAFIYIFHLKGYRMFFHYITIPSCQRKTFFLIIFNILVTVIKMIQIIIIAANILLYIAHDLAHIIYQPNPDSTPSISAIIKAVHAELIPWIIPCIILGTA